MYEIRILVLHNDEELVNKRGEVVCKSRDAAHELVRTIMSRTFLEAGEVERESDGVRLVADRDGAELTVWEGSNILMTQITIEEVE